MREQFELSKVLEFLKNTEEESWCVDVVKTKDGKNCLFGHIFDYGGSECFDWFENIATTYMVYPVNDGKHPRYQQDTPKKRCISYVENLLNGIEKTTYQLMEEEYDRIKKG
ncbi:MAG: hypothetical protein [Caudoviricetes sp.]|nr:MAG: hypothetical protein [Caudoviricetes sp.]